jgi:hypothetical protein
VKFLSGLGHALFEPDLEGQDPVNPDDEKDLRGLNVKRNENPVMAFWSLPLRKHDHGFPIPGHLQWIQV